MSQSIQIKTLIPIELAGSRLDQALAILYPQYSRARWQSWIKAGEVTLNGNAPRSKDKVQGGESIFIDTTLPEQSSYMPEDIPLDIIFEDKELMVINKAAGLVVHPGVGNWQGTLLNALLHHQADLNSLPRAGIVHRLDKDTSGLLIIAKTLTSHQNLVKILEQREIHREYIAVVNGVLTAGGSVDEPIGRHPIRRTLMAVNQRGKPAVSHYRVMERFDKHTLVRVMLESGRTHQIRVHMAHIGHPLLGDSQYGKRLQLPKGADQALISELRGFKRQALHATKLRFEQPTTGKSLEFVAELPSDMEKLVKSLQAASNK